MNVACRPTLACRMAIVYRLIAPCLSSCDLHRYRRCSDADHIRRDVGIFSDEAKKLADEKKLIDQIMSFKEQVLAMESF